MQALIPNQIEMKPLKQRRVLKIIGMWCLVFGVSFATLVWLDVAPSETKEVGGYLLGLFAPNTNSAIALDTATAASIQAEPILVQVTSTTVATPNATPVNPLRVVIKKVGVDTVILNPVNKDIKSLDEALLKGAVRYPGSGTLEDGLSIFLLGHSSYLKTINNKAYKAFNRLQELQLGDEVQLFSANRLYIYKVTKIELVDANEGAVNLSSKKKKVILSTCDSFGKKSDRFVVEATFVGSRAIPLNQR